jgi:hypothetical protein
MKIYFWRFKMIKVINHVAVELIKGNIIEQQGYTAVVNAANAELMPGGELQVLFTGRQVLSLQQNVNPWLL